MILVVQIETKSLPLELYVNVSNIYFVMSAVIVELGNPGDKTAVG